MTAADEELDGLLSEEEVPPRARVRRWPLWWSLAILIYAAVFAVSISTGIAWATVEERDARVPLFVTYMFPVGPVVLAALFVVDAFVAILISPAIAQLVGGFVVFPFAFAIGTAHGAIVFAVVHGLNFLRKSVRARFRRDRW